MLLDGKRMKTVNHIYNHRFFIKGCDLIDYALATSLIMITIKFWNWFLPMMFK